VVVASRDVCGNDCDETLTISTADGQIRSSSSGIAGTRPPADE
jgi:hypothetical protein